MEVTLSGSLARKLQSVSVDHGKPASTLMSDFLRAYNTYVGIPQHRREAPLTDAERRELWRIALSAYHSYMKGDRGASHALMITVKWFPKIRIACGSFYDELEVARLHRESAKATYAWLLAEGNTFAAGQFEEDYPFVVNDEDSSTT